MEEYIKEVVERACGPLNLQIKELEEKASALRAEATTLAAVVRQELENEFSGRKSLWRVVQTLGSLGESGRTYRTSYTVLAVGAEEAKGAARESWTDIQEGRSRYLYGDSVLRSEATPLAK